MVTFGQGELGFIVGGRRRYQITWDDLLWAARMLVGEAGRNAGSNEGAAVLWCMASRLVQLNRTSFTGLIQAYSQPINPKWAEDGEFCQVGGRYNGRDECSPERLERRRRYQTMAWEDIPSDVQDLVYKWATAQVNNPIPRATHFAVPRVASRSRGVEGLRARQGQDGNLNLVWDTLNRDEDSVAGNGNAFYSTEKSRTWEDRFVKVYLDAERREASDSNVEAVGRETRPLASSGSRQGESPQATTLEPPPNDIFERTSTITSDRTEPPDTQYAYLQVDGEYTDVNAQEMLSARDTELIARNSADRFLQQVNSLRLQSGVQMTQMVPVIQIFAEDDEGGVVNLNEIIFSVSPHDRSFSDEFEVFPDRPLASLESFEITVQEPSVGGVTGISMGTLSMKVHNPEMVTRSHPIGKYIAYMMSQGFVMRIRYGMEGAFDSTILNVQQAFQWKEEDFFVTEYRITINNDKTMSLSVKLMPATQRLLNQIHIGQSIPVAQLGTLKTSDIDNIVGQVASSDPNVSQDQVAELRRRLSRFNLQLNAASGSAGVGLEERGNGTFGLAMHAALTNEEIFSREEGIHSVPVPNMVEALQGIQGVLLTRRFENILQKNCYRSTHRDISFNAVNVGPLVYEIVKPEIDYVFGTVTRNQIEIGEKFSVDDRPARTGQRTARSNVKLIFGNFNARAGQWAGKAISSFPVNVEAVFSHLRRQRDVGQFSSTVNEFFGQIRRLVQQDENYDAESGQGSEEVRYRIEKPSIKYVIYPDLTDASSWIMYVYDDKVPVVRLREALDALATESGGRSVPSKEQVKRILKENGIPWIEMGEENAFIKQFSADTISDDLLASHNMVSTSRQQRTIRDMDATEHWPAGISREFVASTQMIPQQIIRRNSYVAPIRVSVTSMVLPTAYYMAPIFVFFPVRTFSGVYIVSEVRHDIKAQGAITNLNLIINISVYNQIAL